MKEKKAALFNKLGREDLEEELNNETFKRITVSLYRYVNIKNPEIFRDVLYGRWAELNIKGRIYLAKEGINAQFSCPEDNWEAFIETLEDYDYLKDVPLKILNSDRWKEKQMYINVFLLLQLQCDNVFLCTYISLRRTVYFGSIVICYVKVPSGVWL